MVRYLWINRTLGTISLEKSYPGYDISNEIVPIQFGYDFSWVRFLLGTISPPKQSHRGFDMINIIFSARANDAERICERPDVVVL